MNWLHCWLLLCGTAWLTTTQAQQQSFRKNHVSANATGLDSIIDEIISSRRQGRNFDEYDEVYADGNIDQALQLGDETEARNIIRDKLCLLGLMSCAPPQQRPHYAPIYPQQSMPERFPHGLPARPILPPGRPLSRPIGGSFNTHVPPRKGDYPHSPLNSAIIYGNRPTGPILSSVANGGLHQNNIYSQSAAVSASNIVPVPLHPNAGASSMQQHIHHHFHHVNGANGPSNAQSTNSQSLANFGGIRQPSGQGLNSFISSTSSANYRPDASLSFGYNQPGVGHITAGFHTQNPSYHKKELQHIGGIAAASQNQAAYNPARQEVVDCQCVAYSQCATVDRIGRKEDLLLNIDPRNLGKDIAAAADVASPSNTTARTNIKRSSDTDRQEESSLTIDAEGRAYYGNRQQLVKRCGHNEVCCRRPIRPASQQLGYCGMRNAAGITGRIKNPAHVDGDSEFGEYPWHVAILRKDPKESIYACGGTLIDNLHVITAAHCIKGQTGFQLRARLGEWDVNHDVEFFPYIERNIVAVHIHPEFYAGTLDNDLALVRLDQPVDFNASPHISPACLPDKYADFTGLRCWTTGWGKDAFGEHGKYQNILKEVDVPILSHQQCEFQLRQTRLGFSYRLHPGFLCAGGEEGKDACKGDGGGPLVCQRNGLWHVVGVVSWGIGCGQVNVPGVYVRVAHYLDWIQQLTQQHK